MNFWDMMAGVLDGFGVLIGIASILTGLLALLIAVWGLRAFVRHLNNAANVVASWSRAQATITKVIETDSPVPGEGKMLISSYIFTDMSGKEFSGEDIEPVIKDPVVGMSLEVAYNPENPEESHPTKHIKRRISGWAILFVIVECLLFACACLLFALGFGAIF